jgi:AcrR family transcriptional regulator
MSDSSVIADVSARGRGRPRDPDIDRRVMEATTETLVSDGFAGTTIQAVARKAGVRSSAIYRRWPSRLALIEEAIFPGFDDVSVEPTGDLRRDFDRFIQAYRIALAKPAALVAMPALLSTYHSGSDNRPPEARGWRSVRPQFQAILRAAPAGTVDPKLDVDDVFDLLLGAVIYRIFIISLGARADAPDHTSDLMCRAVRPL